MSIKIEVPLEGRIRSVPIKFPDSCVYCGAPKQITLPKIINRKFGDEVYKMYPIDIPYCEQHFNEIKTINAKVDKLNTYLMYLVAAISVFVSLLFLYKPLFNWLTSGREATFVPQMPSFASGFATVMIILFGPALILFMAIGTSLGNILDIFFKLPDGLKTDATGNLTRNLLFDFQNEQVAEEFLAMNQECSVSEL